jgi:hypothetical protein
VGSNVAIESRPEGAELNGEEIHSPTYPGAALRFALGYLILPLWGGEMKNPRGRSV